MNTPNPNLLRQQYRQLRRTLNQNIQTQAAKQALTHCQLDENYQKARRVALYLANDGELNPSEIIKDCWQQQKQVYLPVLHPFCPGHLLFLRYQPDSHLRANLFGIAEPVLDCARVCPLDQLDLIFTPLVAFDLQGNRLGMGGGFYDRTLAPVRKHNLPTSIFGLAHDCQQSPRLFRQTWDIPLHRIITPSRVISVAE